MLEVEVVGALEHLDQHQFVRGADHLAVAAAPAMVAHHHAVAERDAGYAAHEQQAAACRRGQPVFLAAHARVPFMWLPSRVAHIRRTAG
jgi:predicted transcriptional regulator